ncbi:site-specific integrase [Klebsiella aerogenes]|uniref:site-specific integrase n=1 Tax=Klebsiella aerogenes TaxID=548 RepID=UPI001CC53604|nr:site-specific integrase [Klebsiella aerogenes]UNX66915.1 site-specific integrase [Klebsiella aerogenes]
MAFYTIEKRLKADGTSRYRCVVGIKSGGKYTHRESKTFSRQAHAKTWGQRRVIEIERDGGAEREQASITLHDLIDLYLKSDKVRVGESKRYALALIMRRDLANKDATELREVDVVEFGKQRLAEGVQTGTVNSNLSYIATVLKCASPIFGIKINMAGFDAAREYMWRTGMMTEANKRTRRPTRQESDLILEGLRKRELTAYSKTPFSRIYLFSILTCMRIGEVLRLRWQDVDSKSKSILVRDRKDPRKKIGNHMVVPLLGEAWDILQEQPRRGELIFPYARANISKAFRLVKNSLGIEDLHYHDLRREGASRLFEMGFSVEEVAQVTGHKNLQTLWTVYREIYPQTLHERFEQLKDRSKPTK